MDKAKKTEPKRGKGRPLSLPGPIGELVEKLGGKREYLASIAGCDVKTVYRWAHDNRVGSKPAKDMLEKLFKKHGVVDGVEAFLKASGAMPKPISKRMKLGEPKGE